MTLNLNVKRGCRRALSAAALAAIAAMVVPSGCAWATPHFRVLHAFTGGSDGKFPVGDLIFDKSGNLVGATKLGGGGPNCGGNCGTVFKIASDGTETVFHAFNDQAVEPWAGVIVDKIGNLYGTTADFEGPAGGTVYELAEDGSETVLHVFDDENNSQMPFAGLVADKAGNLYGTTFGEGELMPFGTIFKVMPDGTAVLHALGGSNGTYPRAPVILDKAGNLYGTAVGGGPNCDCGVVFKLSPDGTETVLHAFSGPDGFQPYGGLISDASGNLYGTTAYGGAFGGEGTVFKLAPDGTLTVLYTFKTGADGAVPHSRLVMDNLGNLYGTTWLGGKYGGKGSVCEKRFGDGCGTIFKLAPDGTHTVLHVFNAATDGSRPDFGLVMDRKGNLYGVAPTDGPSGGGTVFELKP